MIWIIAVGFMSIDRLKLNVIKEAGTLEEVDMVERVGPILENHHLLLVTLLLCNALAMEALPIFLDRLVPSVVAVILSVTFVLIFGEIVPQGSSFHLFFIGFVFPVFNLYPTAYCTSNPLKICSSAAWLVRLLEFITYPITFPVARLLDRVLGDHSAHVLFKRSELTALIKLHSSEGSGLSITHGPLKHDEANVIRGALETGNRKATDVMTKMQHVCMLEIDRIMDMNTLAEILGMGHSRIPVFHKSRHNIKGLLLVKRLIVCNPDDHRPLYHFVHRKPIVVTPDIGLYELLNVFQTGRSHMAIVTEHTREYHWAMSTGEDVVRILFQISTCLLGALLIFLPIFSARLLSHPRRRHSGRCD
jgi:metal transporter CNNM